MCEFKGNYSTVYIKTLRESNRKVAIKQFSNTCSDQYINEVQLCRDLKMVAMDDENRSLMSRHVAFPLHMEPGNIIYPYYGRDLLDWYNQCDKTQQLLPTVFMKAFESLRVFHMLGFTHGDVKLENFVFGGASVVIVDYGESYHRSTVTTHRFAKGTLSYSSIPVMEGNCPLVIDDYISLIYSFTYTLVGGSLWFSMDNAQDIKAAKILFLTQRFKEDSIIKAIQAIVLKCYAVERSQTDQKINPELLQVIREGMFDCITRASESKLPIDCELQSPLIVL